MADIVITVIGSDRPGLVESIAATVAMGKGPLPEVARADVAATFHVRRSDLDVVRHVTNTQLVSWVAETVPEGLEETHRLTALEIVFQREARLGDVVAAETQGLEDDADGRPTFAHVLRHAGDGRELVRAVTTWARG